MWYLPLDFGDISMEQTSQFSEERERGEREYLLHLMVIGTIHKLSIPSIN